MCLQFFDVLFVSFVIFVVQLSSSPHHNHRPAECSRVPLEIHR